MLFCHRFQPDCLPDTGGEDIISFFTVLATRSFAVVRVIDANHQLILPGLQLVGDIE